MSKLLVALVLSLAIGRVCFAGQETTATVRVNVEQVPSTAALILVAAAQPTLSLTVTVAPGTAAVFRHIPPGQYRVILQRPGFADVATDAFLVAGVTYDWLAEVTQANGGDPVLAIRTLVPNMPGGTRFFDQEMLRSYPAEDTLWSVVETAAAPLIVDRMSTGGLWAGEAARVGGNGASWRQTGISRGALDVTDPLRVGTPLLRANHDGVDALVVATSMLPASSSGPGPNLMLLPRLPSPTWSGEAMVGIMPEALRPTAPNSDGVAPIAQFANHHDGEVALGGPVNRRAGLFLSLRHSATKRVEVNNPTPVDSNVVSVSADLTLHAGRDTRLQVSTTLDHTDTPYPGQPRLTEAAVHEHDLFGSVQATWQGWTKGGSGWSASTGFVKGTFEPQLSSSAEGVGTAERLESGPIPYLFELPGISQRWSARLDAEPALTRFRRHLVRGGVSIAGNTAVTTGVPLAPVAELVDGIPARLWEYHFIGAEARWHSTETAFYISDGIALGPRVSLDAGLRMESTRASTQSGSQISWFSPTPRITARWNVDSAGHFSAFAGFSQYADRLPLDVLAYGDNAGLAGSVYRWLDGNGNGQYEPGERGSLVTVVGPCCVATGISRISPELKRPSTRELTAGVDGRFGDWLARTVILDRHTRDLIGVVNTGVGVDDYTAKVIPDAGENFFDPADDRLLTVYDRTPASFGQDRYLVTNPDGATSDYVGLEVTLEGRPTGAWHTRFDGTAYFGSAIGSNRGYGPTENDPGVLGEAFAVPNAATYSRGRPVLERAYVIKWWTAYTAPHAVVVSGVARYQDGQSFARMVVVPDLNQGAEAILAYRRGRTRFTFSSSVDLHVEKTFTLDHARLAGIVEVFNLLNTRKEVAEDVLTTPQFRTATAMQPPLATRVAVRVTF